MVARFNPALPVRSKRVEVKLTLPSTGLVVTKEAALKSVPEALNPKSEELPIVIFPILSTVPVTLPLPPTLPTKATFPALLKLRFLRELVAPPFNVR